MEFRLTYQGKLVSSRTPPVAPVLDQRRENKHDIRCHFHPQLRRFWQLRYPGHFDIDDAEPQRRSNVDQIADRFTNNGFRWHPLVLEWQRVNCSIDVLYLRLGPRGGVLNRADIDNRLKTLVDALKMPKTGEIDPAEKPTPDQDPFFVLLQDDSLVTRLVVEADTLLDHHDQSLGDTDSRVIVTVKIWSE